MLTLAKVSTGAAAASYYEGANDYYSKDRDPSQWMGEGAQRLGLHGEVDAATFRDLLDGKMPNGSQIHNAAEGRRGGTDFTFSAPKSVSMQALVAGDQRLIDAHEKAVASTLRYAEGLAVYRVTEQGVTQNERSGNLLIASFRHDLSRAQDPNLHTHAVVVNATQRADGEWRALQQSEFYRQQKLMGAMYRAELALEVQRLGYEVRLTHTDGRFELAHIDAAQIAAFSTRSQAIESALAAQGRTREDASAREKEVANLATRDKKAEVDRPALHAAWQEKSQALGVNYRPALVTASHADVRQDAAREALAYAVEHTTERQAVVTETTLVRAALEHGTGRTDHAALKSELARQVQSGELVTAGERYTTHAAQQREREMLDVAARGRGAVAPIMSEQQAQQTLSATALNDGQRAAAALVVTSNERIVAIQGAAGTGKTTMLRQAKELAEAQGYRVQGLAPSASAARELEKAGIPSQTVAAFQAQDRNNLNDKTVLVMDEAGMVAAKDMHQVLHAAEAGQARVVLVGDVQQLKAVEAGRPFAQLQEAGIARVEMGEIQRQNDARLKHAVELAAKGNVERSLAVLSKHIHEIDGNRERYARIAQDYAALAPAERAQTLVVAGTHAARTAINDNVRGELGLAGKGIMVSTLTRNDLTQAQARMSLSYQPGDVVEARKPYESLGMQRGDLARVVDAGAGKVTLERSDGGRVQWRPALQHNMNAYRENPRELSVGDQVRLTANDYARGMINGDHATVTAIDQERQTVDIQKADGSAITLDASKPMHLDHGYCSTVHAAQGQTCERVLIEADTRSATANESSYYVAISRAREEVAIYTDDKELLPEAMGREDAKDAALDVKHKDMEAEVER
jgi:conjugative relaxase-like TrwC/TraI family protein